MKGKSGHINAVEKAFRLLDCFIHSNEPLSLKELAQRTGLPKSTVHSLLSSMRSQEIIVQNESDGKYCMGIHMFELGNAVSKSLDIINIAKPYMKAVADTLNKTVHLTTLRGDQTVLIARMEPVKNPLKMIVAVGTPMPLYCTAPGKLFLAYMPESAALEYLHNTKLIPHTPYTITDPNIFLEQFKSIRANGVATEAGERNIGIHGIAAPIFNALGKTVYSIAAVGIVNFAKAPDSQFAKELIMKVAADISHQLGYKAPAKII